MCFAPQHNSAHIFDIWTSKSGPNLVVFVHFDFHMCFAPHRCKLFRHGNFQKWSETVSFLHFWLGNALRATPACTFLTSSTWTSVREWCASYILTWKASCHNGVQIFISHLARCLRICRFSEPTFGSSRATNHWKNTVKRDFLPFRAPASSLFSLFLFPDLLTSWLLLSDSSHLCSSICPFCRKFHF